MIARFIRSLRRFSHHRAGNFAVIGALSALPLIMAMGGAIDMGTLYARRSVIQDAADAAALAAAKQFPVDPDETSLAATATTFFNENVGSLYRTEATLVFDGVSWTADHAREVKLHVRYAYDPIFLPIEILDFDGVKGRPVSVASSVLVSDTTVEVAMVLDTSGSMNSAPSAGGEAKITTLRRVASNAAKGFFKGTVAGIEKPTQIAIVPFSGAVNVGPQNLDAAWMDPKGLSPVHQENFDWSTYTDAKGAALGTQDLVDKTWTLKSDLRTKLTRQYLYKTMRKGTAGRDCLYLGINYPGCVWSGSYGSWTMKSGVLQICTQSAVQPTCQPYAVTYAGNPLYGFEGCVETRTGAYALNDAVPSESTPATLFVPWFAPDEPDEEGDNSFLKDQTWQDPAEHTPLKDKAFAVQQKNLNKYLLLPSVSKSMTANNLYSPGFLCDSDPILALSDSAATVDAKIRSLVATGSTNIEEGIGWGWRTLSASAPFTEGRPASDTKNIKALILMTDGENTYYADSSDNRSRYGSYGFSSTERIFDQATQPKTHTNTNFTLTMEAHTRKVCQNAKDDGRQPMLDANGRQLGDEKGSVTDDGILIYTIAFDIPSASAARIGQLLTDCASYRAADLRNTGLAYAKKTKYYYSAKNEAELDTAFKEIMASLSKLRVSH